MAEDNKKIDISETSFLDLPNPLDLSKRGLAYLAQRRYPGLIAADLASSVIPRATKEVISETLKKPFLPGVSNKLREAFGFEPHYILNADGTVGLTGSKTFEKSGYVPFNKGQKINYPATRKTPVSPAKNKMIELVEEKGVDFYNTPKGRKQLFIDVKKSLPRNYKTRKDTPLTAKHLNDMMTELYGSAIKIGPSIFKNPKAVKLIDNLMTNNPSIKTPEIKQQLIDIDPVYKDIKDQSIRDYLKRTYKKGTRTTKTDTTSGAAREKMRQAMDDPKGSANIASLRDRIASYFDDILEKGKTRQGGQKLAGAHPTQIKFRTKGDTPITQKNYEEMLQSGKAIKEAKTFITTTHRNNRHIALENSAKNLMNKKNKLLENFNYKNKTDMTKYKKIESDIIKVKNEMKKLGLQSKLYNPRIKRYEYFGKLYGSKKSPILALRESILDPAVEGVGRKHGGIVSINQLTRPL